MPLKKENKRLRRCLKYSLRAKEIDNDISKRNFYKHIIIALIIGGVFCFCAYQFNSYFREEITFIADTEGDGNITVTNSLWEEVNNGETKSNN